MTLLSTIFFVSSSFLLMLCMGIPMATEESDNGCFVFVECHPGEEVKTCRESNGFNCTRCLPGYVQPNYVTSNQHNNTCFKPHSVCVAEDVTYSRTEHDTFCDSLDGCKCNTNKCYFGDPCLCDQHTPGCPVNKSLDENGVCQPCDTGTAKNDTRCGPCRSVLQKLHSLPGNVTAMIHKKRSLMPTMETITSEEVKTCRKSNGFNCTRCLPGYVQPNYVTSNQHNNKCFKPHSDCVAEGETFLQTKTRYFENRSYIVCERTSDECGTKDNATRNKRQT
ncbi:unnamed protein product [Mytilus coruscus]|uniref:TNFR-Cys domain-containing protein n=1 Tax=Mytilus coruscus TaxID=42192 RepID=A0A6J8BIX4_MYTCO|nr:unnamed protein product [Mytilus coruscus]